MARGCHEPHDLHACVETINARLCPKRCAALQHTRAGEAYNARQVARALRRDAVATADSIIYHSSCLAPVTSATALPPYLHSLLLHMPALAHHTASSSLHLSTIRSGAASRCARHLQPHSYFLILGRDNSVEERRARAASYGLYSHAYSYLATHALSYSA